MQSDYGSSALSQYVAAEWLNSGAYDEHLAYVRQELKIRRQTALEALDVYLGDYAEWEIPQGGFFIWVKIKAAYKISRLFQKVYAKGVILNPGSIYFAQNEQYIRISYANASLEELKEGIFRLGEIVRYG